MDSWKWFFCTHVSLAHLTECILTWFIQSELNDIPCLVDCSASSLTSLYALNSVDCITIGSKVAWKLLCRPFLAEPPNARLIVELGYGSPFGPMQFVESVRASPERYLRFPLPLHFSDEKSGQSDSAVVMKMLIIRLIVAINCELKWNFFVFINAQFFQWLRDAYNSQTVIEFQQPILFSLSLLYFILQIGYPDWWNNLYFRTI